MTTLHTLRLGVFAACIVAASPVLAQAPAPAPAAAQAGQQRPANATPATPKVDLPAPPANYEYTVAGRRDPFVSLVNRGSESGATSPDGVPVKRAEGVPGMLTGELKVRGIVQTRGVWVAMVSGADNKIYTVRAGDKVADGVIRTITATTVVILQEVNDPLSLQKQREVRKFLRGGEEVK